VAEKKVVIENFPIPLINRLEKHFLAMNTMLTDRQRELAQRLQRWAEDFSSTGLAGHRTDRYGQCRPWGTANCATAQGRQI
jgi:hypothetical protein